MSHGTLSKIAEVDRNLSKFLELLPTLLPGHAGQYALMRHGEVLDFFDTALDAQIAGNQRFVDRVFSIQPVMEVAEELGCFSYAVDPREAWRTSGDHSGGDR